MATSLVLALVCTFGVARVITEHARREQRTISWFTRGDISKLVSNDMVIVVTPASPN